MPLSLRYSPYTSVMRKGRLVVLIGVFLLLALAVSSGWLLVIDQPRKSDVILVLAGETDKRPARGLELLGQGFAPRMILDVPANIRIYQWTQGQLAQKYVDGISPSKQISICPIVGLSTRDEARDALRCMQEITGKNVLLVTSDFHTRRAFNIFRHEISDHNFSVAAAFDPSTFGTQWWRQREWAKTAVSEWAKLLWWELVDRWR
jgi:uncharacterized SAM-binding protein YcdF (DUF218 family)